MSGTALLPAALAGLALAAGTYAFRFAGPTLRRRLRWTASSTRILDAASVVLLVAVMTTSALTEDQHGAGWARPGGVLVAGVLAWRRAPFLVVVVAGTLTTAVLRLTGLP